MILKFNRMTFKDGPNLTVRRGSKWGDATGLVQIDGPWVDSGTLKPRCVEVVFSRTMRFCDLVDEDLFHEHDSECRTVE